MSVTKESRKTKLFKNNKYGRIKIVERVSDLNIDPENITVNNVCDIIKIARNIIKESDIEIMKLKTSLEIVHIVLTDECNRYIDIDTENKNSDFENTIHQNKKIINMILDDSNRKDESCESNSD